MTASVHYGRPASTTIDDVRSLYADYGWWEDRDDTDLGTALRNTDELVTLHEDGTLVGAARVITDYVYYANVFDVIVAADRRGEGLGERLLDGVVSHPQLSGVGLSLLCRRGLVPFYETAGFEAWDGRAEVPEHGQEEEFVRMLYRRTEDGGADAVDATDPADTE